MPHSQLLEMTAATHSPGAPAKKQAHRSGGAAADGSALASLPPIPEHDPVAGVASILTGAGQRLAPPSTDALLAALRLFDVPPPAPSAGATAAAAAPPPLPTGAAWQLVALATPNGIQTHAVQPGTAVPARDIRGEHPRASRPYALHERHRCGMT